MGGPIPSLHFCAPLHFPEWKKWLPDVELALALQEMYITSLFPAVPGTSCSAVFTGCQLGAYWGRWMMLRQLP